MMITKKAIIASGLAIALLILGATGIAMFDRSALAAVTLASFTATGGDGQVLIEWETASEIDNIGFNLYRSTSEGGPYVRINDSLIPSKALGSVMGAYYCYTDSDVINGITYYYKLEDMDVHGCREFHGPISATPGAQPTATPTPTLTPTQPTATAIPPTRSLYRVYLSVILKNYSPTAFPTPIPCVDEYEPDDTWQQARWIEVNQVIQSHNFHTSDDRDYVRFVAEADSVYTIRTLNLSAGNDTTLTLYGTDGITQLEHNDDDPYNPPASKIVWLCSTTGIYFVKAAPYGTRIGGCDKTYDLKITSAPTPTSTPTPPFDDPYEPNNSFSTAWRISSGETLLALINPGSDLDYFRFDIQNADYPITVWLKIPDPETMMYAVDLYDAESERLGTEANQAGEELISITHDPAETGRYYVKVYSPQSVFDPSKPYELRVVFDIEPTPTPVPTSTPTSTPTPTHTPMPSPTPTVVGVPMIAIPAGEFIMGSDVEDERPPHLVFVEAYEIDRFEVTNQEFERFVWETGYVTDAEKAGDTSWRYYATDKPNHPVVKVSLNDARAFCEWAGKRPPTEAEWEKAARGTDARTYPWGNQWDASKANTKEAGNRGTTPVGSFPDGASPYGVMDMAGNVAEWTVDWYKAYPGSDYYSPYFGEKYRVIRGGGWFSDQNLVRTTKRSASSVTTANDDLGFRCAR
jgi:sulfatase modifying factor 1